MKALTATILCAALIVGPGQLCAAPVRTTPPFGCARQIAEGKSDGTLQSLTADETAKQPGSDSFPQDSSARTWLPIAGASALAPGDVVAAPADAFLKGLRATLRPVVCWYKGASLQASRTLPGGTLELPESKWELTTDAKTVVGEPDARDLVLTLSLEKGQAADAGFAAVFDFSDWSTDNYVLLPASVYNGNRNRIVSRGYAAGS